MVSGRIAGCLLEAFFVLAVSAQGHPPPKKIQVAEGIFLLETADYGDVGLDGNSIVILSRDGVLVFDANGTPAAAAAVLAEIRKITPLPVLYLIISHWHWDHWYGAEVYKEAFPNIQIITQENNRRMMMGPALEFNRPGLEKQLPAYIDSLAKKVAEEEKANPAPPKLAQHKALVEEDRFFLQQKLGVHHTFPNVTFTQQMNLYLGEREIELLNYNRAVTPGDTFMYLPKEKILVTGDLLVNPISFALSCYPTGWLTTLEKMDALDASILLPGHGDPLHDKELLRANMEVMRELLREGKDAKIRGLTADQAKAEVLPSLHGLMVEMTHDDRFLNHQFEIYLVDWYLHRVYDELNGPLTDDVAPIPSS